MLFAFRGFVTFEKTKTEQNPFFCFVWMQYGQRCRSSVYVHSLGAWKRHKWPQSFPKHLEASTAGCGRTTAQFTPMLLQYVTSCLQSVSRTVTLFMLMCAALPFCTCYMSHDTASQKKKFMFISLCQWFQQNNRLINDLVCRQVSLFCRGFEGIFTCQGSKVKNSVSQWVGRNPKVGRRSVVIGL